MKSGDTAHARVFPNYAGKNLKEQLRSLLKPCGVIKKKREIRIREGVSPPPCPTPIKIFFGQGFPKAH